MNDTKEDFPKMRDASYGEFQEEYELRLLHRMMLRNLPLDMMAKALKLDIAGLLRKQESLKEWLADEALNLDTVSLLGDSLNFYSEVKGSAMQIAGNTKNETPERSSALKIAMDAQKERDGLIRNASRSQGINPQDQALYDSIQELLIT